MTEHSRNSRTAGADRDLPHGEPGDGTARHRVGMRRLGAMTLALALSAAGSQQGWAQHPGDPAPNHVWGGCILNSTGSGGSNDTIEDLIENIEVGDGLDGESIEVAFVVVYALANPNDGQPLDGEGDPEFTGPILCINPHEVDITAFEADGETLLTEDSDIPTDTGPEGATSVDLRSAEEQFILQYQVNGGDRNGTIEKRICHTVGGNTDCFIVFPDGE